jgi:CBS-domain-containing membrane protein
MQVTTTHPAIKSFLDLTAANLMSTPVRTLPQEMSLREAAQLLTHDNISGAPVVDANGRCVGVLSASDFVTRAGKDGNGKVTRFVAPWGEMIDLEEFPENTIRQYMTTQPVTVAPATPIGALAQTMVDAHIHRVLVVVDQNPPQGIVTSTDVLAAVARTAQRAALEGERRRTKGSRSRR